MTFPIYTGSSWADVNSLFVHQGLSGGWTEIKRVYVSVQGVEFGTTEWEHFAVFDPELPAPPQPELEQVQFSGGDVEASWANPPHPVPLGVRIEWEINSSSFDVRTLSLDATSDLLDEADLSNFDQVRARIQYFEESFDSEWGPWSDTLNYTD